MATRYLLRRLATSALVLLGVTLVTFILLHSAAGGIVPGLENDPRLRPEDIANIRRTLGLDAPLWVQYLNWVGLAVVLAGVGLGGIFGDAEVRPGLLQLDFGRSLLDGSPVASHILDRLPLTLELTLASLVLALLVSVPLGVAGATRRGRLLDKFFTVLSVLGVSVPQFWLGLMMILFFSVQLNAWGLPWLPSTGAFNARGSDLLDHLAHLVMPSVVLAFGYIAIWSRYARSSMLEVLSQDYVRTARGKGLAEGRVLYVHTLRNALIPLITLIGLELPALVSGGAIVEVVFGWPGIGRLALERALAFDYTMVMGLTAFVGVFVVLGNLMADVLYVVADPRMRSA